MEGGPALACAHLPRLLPALLAALILVPSARAQASATYSDAEGDAAPWVPDITSVTISDDPTGDVTFQIAFSNRAIVSGRDGVTVWVDSDRNRRTGFAGAEYAISVWGPSPATAFVWVPARDEFVGSSLAVWASGGVSFAVDKTQLRSETGRFFFSVMSANASSSGAVATDWVPDDNLYAAYPLATAIGKIQLPKVATSVKAGSVFSVRQAMVELSSGEVLSPEGLTAQATVAGRAVRPQVGGLAWRVPQKLNGRTTVGEKFVVKMTATCHGMTKTQRLALRIVK